MNNFRKKIILILLALTLFFKILGPGIIYAQVNPIQSAKDTLLYLWLRLTNNDATDQPPTNIPTPGQTIPNQPVDPNITLPPLPPINASKLTRILYWANIINAKLVAVNHIWPPWWYYHKMTDTISNGGYTAIRGSAHDLASIYWCTFLVIDSYNLSGLRGLTPAHSAVLNMVPFFMNTSGYVFIPYSVYFSRYSPPSYRTTSITERKQALTKVQPGCAVFFQSKPGVHERNHTAIIRTKSLDSNFNGFIETLDSNNTVRVVRYPIREGIIQNTLYVPDSLRGFGCPT